MTWEEWINSDYCDTEGGSYISGTAVIVNGGKVVGVTNTDIIENNGTYTLTIVPV